ncbi:hypothetical protein Tco_1045502 [Tanacetum coccineum]|uniref:Xylulose kinase-1 n=1 Tax=Tanacetum coccineum TaxID=301880 RepID=A0ABQ5GUW5_9ASTR
MTTLQFADTHNLVAFLAKPAESEGFEQVVDFLNAHTIKYALTVNPTIYTLCIEQFWATVKLKTVNREQQLQALVDGKKTVVTEASVRRDLQLDDDEATNQKFNFSKYIFESMVKNLDNAGKFLMYPRFIQVFLDNQLEGMSSHKRIYVTPSHTKKIFANMRRQGKDFSERETSLSPTMVVQAQEEIGGQKERTLREHKDCLSLGDYKFKEESQEVREERRVTHKLRRLYQVGRSARVVSFDEASLGDQEDASKQGRKINDIDADAGITLDSTYFDADTNMFGVHDLDGDEVVVESKVAAKKKDDEVNVVEEVVSAAEETVNAATITEDEITLARALAELKSKVTTATTTTTKGILLQEPSESITTTTIPLKDKGKAEFDEEVRLAREKDEANVGLIEEWNDIQVKIDADYQMVKQMQAEEQEELSIEEKSKLFVQLLEARKKHFATKKAEEKRNRPPTRAQQRSIMYMDTELIEGSEVRAEGSETRKESSSKRVGDELEQEKAKKQKVDEDKETAELQSLMKVIPDEEEVAVDAIPLATKPSSIVDWKILKEGKISYYQIIRADGSLKRYSAFIQMLRSFDREDLESLWKLVKAKHGYTRPEEGCERVLWGDLKTMFEHHVEDTVLHVFMLVEKRYPLTPATITEMLNKKLQADHWNEMWRIVRIKILLDDLRVTAAKLMLLVYKLLLLVFRVNAAGTKLQLLKDYNC